MLSFIKWSLTGVVFHWGGLSLGWSFTGVVCYGGLSSMWSQIRVVFHHSGLLLEWSLFQVNLSSGCLLSGRSFIGVVSKQGGLLSGVLCALDRRNTLPVSITEAYIHGAAQLGEDGGVVVDDGAAGAGQTLHLVDHQVTALVLLVIGHHKAL